MKLSEKLLILGAINIIISLILGMFNIYDYALGISASAFFIFLISEILNSLGN